MRLVLDLSENIEVVLTEEAARLGLSVEEAATRVLLAWAEDAARTLGLSITAFTETALAEKAQHVLAEQERIILSEAQFARFVEILEDKTPPTSALQQAMDEFQATKTAHADRGL